MTNFISKRNITVLAVYLLGGSNKYVDTEDVAMKCNEIAKGQFTWKKYKDQINLKLVETFLWDATKDAYGGLLIGSGRKGWRLSSNGISWMADSGESILKSKNFNVDEDKASAGSIDTVRKTREERRIKGLNAWKRWLDNQDILIKDAQEIFRIDDYITGKMIDVKIARLKSLFYNDEELKDFLEQASKVILDRG